MSVQGRDEIFRRTKKAKRALGAVDMFVFDDGIKPVNECTRDELLVGVHMMTRQIEELQAENQELQSLIDDVDSW